MQQRVAEFQWKDGRIEQRAVSYPLPAEYVMFRDAESSIAGGELRSPPLRRHVFQLQPHTHGTGRPVYIEVHAELVDDVPHEPRPDPAPTFPRPVIGGVGDISGQPPAVRRHPDGSIEYVPGDE